MDNSFEKELETEITVNEIEADSKPGETKAEKFSRIGIYRMNKAIHAINNLGKLSNRSSYEYTDEQVEKMFTTLEDSVHKAKESFCNSEKKSASFTF